MPRRSTWRNVSAKDKMLLWGRAAARCNHPSCKRFLVEPATSEDADAMFGQAAHIIAHGSTGPRADPSYPKEKLDTYENLILLCGNCHAIVDKQPNTYTPSELRAWKQEHESWVQQVTEPVGHVPVPWLLLLQEDQPQIDDSLAVEALQPDVANGEAHRLVVTPDEGGWEAAARKQEEFVEVLLGSVKPEERRLAVFSLTRIPLAVHLGYALSDRCRVVVYQYHRDEQQWSWPPALENSSTLARASQEVFSRDATGALVIRVSLSAKVTREVTTAVVDSPIAEVHISVDEPSVTWLRNRQQLVEFAKTFRRTLEWARAELGNRCTGIHLFYAGPTPGAIEIGRLYNPRMNPPLYLYEYHHAREPNYEQVLDIGGGL